MQSPLSKPEPVQEARGDAGPLMLQLALFILLLAFFIVMTALSDFHVDRVGAVMQSVDTAFSQGDATEGPSGDVDRAGILAETAGDLRRLGEQVPALLPLARVPEPGQGDTMLVAIPESELLGGTGGVHVRTDRLGVFNRFAGVLAPRPGGVQVQAELLLAQDTPDAVAKAGALARALTDVGAPPAALTIGLERGTPGQMRFLFTVKVSGPARLLREATP